MELQRIYQRNSRRGRKCRETVCAPSETSEPQVTFLEAPSISSYLLFFTPLTAATMILPQFWDLTRVEKVKWHRGKAPFSVASSP